MDHVYEWLKKKKKKSKLCSELGFFSLKTAYVVSPTIHLALNTTEFLHHYIWLAIFQNAHTMTVFQEYFTGWKLFLEESDRNIF